MIFTESTGIYKPPSIVYYTNNNTMRSIIVSFEYYCFTKSSLCIIPIPGKINFISTLKNSYESFTKAFCEKYSDVPYHQPYVTVLNHSDRNIEKITEHYKEYMSDSSNLFISNKILDQLKNMYPKWTFVCFDISNRGSELNSTILKPVYISYSPYIAKSGSVDMEVIPIVNNTVGNTNIRKGLISANTPVSSPVNIYFNRSNLISGRSSSDAMIINLKDYSGTVKSDIVNDIGFIPDEFILIDVDRRIRLNGDMLINFNSYRYDRYSITNRHFSKDLESSSL